PLEFQIGESQVIPGFEDTVVEMEEGQSRTETIPTDRAYGERQEERVVQVDRDQFPDDIEPEEGQQLQVQQPDGSSVPVTVTDVSGEEVTLDANHPLAGEDLTFEIELVEIEKE
ncbi:MAG: FKBP-type peptidyl-prolyl cis-trans isomerase, partial [Gemmatimonadota bacterium]|nr:FKBP-type peptidyl-prolyl cis-trans isomerase [Gemmatimonadota bacterium]